MRKKNNMYPFSVFQWNPFVGCRFNCIYCKNSFQAQLKRWAKKNCQKCYNFEPHEHPERLFITLPPTNYMQFIFTCPTGDISFCSTEYIEEIVNVMWIESDKTFLIQSKNPKTFERVKWPDNVILGTTIETNRHTLACPLSKAPPTVDRWVWWGGVKYKRMLTIEPILDFDLEKMIQIVSFINPCMVWLGYDTKKNNLPEPPIEKVKQLHWELSKLSIPVLLKYIPK